MTELLYFTMDRQYSTDQLSKSLVPFIIEERGKNISLLHWWISCEFHIVTHLSSF